MVTVIPSKEELPTPVRNGGTGGSSCDNERPFQFIKDYQEVDFHRSPSCRPLPDDLFETIDGHISKSSIKGTFFLQIDALEASNNQNDHGRLLLTLTDGILTVQATTNESISNLSLNTKPGSKLLLTEIIPIQNNLLQLNQENTRFQYGSSTYPRPRSSYRGNRGNGSYRPSNEGRRNSRYDNDGGENNFFKRPPPKNTLMDFMTSLNISTENDKERTDNHQKRQSTDHQSMHYASNNEQVLFQEEDLDEPLDPEDDPAHANYRERRNPLPPRLQRAQEERSRRNTNRYYDESIPSVTDPQSLSSTSTSYLRHVDPGSYNSYGQSINGSTPTHLTYFPANQLPYNLAGISTPSYPNHQALLGHSYGNEHLNYCCGIPYATYLPAHVNGHSKIPTEVDNLSGQVDENNDSGMKSDTSTNEQKSNDNSTEGKRRDSNANSRPRWKIGDMCFARWSEDGKFYYATIWDIQPPYCTVLFVEYNTYDQVHFGDLKVIPRDQQFYPFLPQTSDVNLLAANAYFPPRYPSTIDGCIIMPEAPPFPFNSAGTLYMYPTSSFPTVTHSNGDLTINSSSSPSKDSNDTSAVDSTSTSHDENHFQHDDSLPQPRSIADAPLTLVTDDHSNVNADEQSTKKEEEDQRE